MRLVQLARNSERRVAVVEDGKLRLVNDREPSIYALAARAIDSGVALISLVQARTGPETLDYNDVYEGKSPWRLLPSFDHPDEPARCLVTGTGLTHKASADNRAAMHKAANAEMTDSQRMYQMGLEGGNVPAGQIGVQPEWFYKGRGECLRAHNEPLDVPPYAWDGGEEPEIAGVYLIAPGGVPYRVGLTIANEFSDHRMEKKNYLYLAPSKLRSCAIGPELAIGNVDFANTTGRVSVFRGGAPLWNKQIRTGQNNMSHTIANLEHHHFKYQAHRRPGDVHIHFFGADAFSFGDGIALENGDVMEVAFPEFGRALRNPVRIAEREEPAVVVRVA
jgi:hypothetical protein